MEISARISNDELEIRTVFLCLNRSVTNSVVSVRIVVGVGPPALGDGRREILGILPVCQVDNVAGRILRTQAGALAIIAGNRAGGRAIREGQFQCYIAGATIRQPVGNLLAILEACKVDIALPSGGGCRLRTNHELRPAARYGNGRQIILVLLRAGHGGHDGVLRNFQFCGIHTLAECIHG